MKNKKSQANLLDLIPIRNEKINYTANSGGIVALEIENKGIFNKMAQICLKKPKISYIHLDENGSFVWLLIDGETDINGIGKRIKEHFGESAEPIYPRLAKYMEILKSYDFISYK